MQWQDSALGWLSVTVSLLSRQQIALEAAAFALGLAGIAAEQQLAEPGDCRGMFVLQEIELVQPNSKGSPVLMQVSDSFS